MEHTANKRNSFAQTDLTIPCKTGNIAVVSAILEWRVDDGERLDISARDEKRKTAFSLAKQSNNAEIVALIEQNLFLRAVEDGDIETVKPYLTAKEFNLEVLYRRTETDHHVLNSEMETQSHEDDLIEEHSPNRFTSKDSITHSVWLEAVGIAQKKCHDEMLKLLFSDQRTVLDQAVADYLTVEDGSYKLKTIEILFKSWKFSANVLNLKNETVCKIRPKRHGEIDDLMRILLQNRIGLNDRNKNGETFLMLACKNKRSDIVRSLVKMASREFVLDIDAVDNSGETALMKAKESKDSEILAALLILKLIYAMEDKKEDIIKSVLDEFRYSSDIFAISWSSNQGHNEGGTVKKERENKCKIWRNVMYIALEKDTKHSEEILKLLLDCDAFLSQEVEIGFSIQAKHLGEDKEHRLIEMLLKSGKINAKASNDEGRTGLHLTLCEKLASLLICHGADVNRKDKEGMTPILRASLDMDMSTIDRRVLILQTILEEAGTLVDLNAIDCDGRTALMKAALWQKTEAVKLLLDAGASVNLSDHLGFTALHYALYGYIWESVELPRNSEELRKRKEMAILFDVEKFHKECTWFSGNQKRSELIMKMVEMLLQRPDIDVNALSFEKFSPLDIAEAVIPETQSSIKDALKEKGAVLNVFRLTESQSSSDFHPDVRCKVILQRLFITVIRRHKEEKNRLDSFNLIKQKILTLIKRYEERIASCKDQRGRTALHLTVIYFSEFYFEDGDCILCIMDLANAVVDQLMSLGCCVNETDNLGRTPLHYANQMFWELLISKGADESIKDKDGNRATDKTSPPSSVAENIVKAVIHPNEETYYLHIMNNKQMVIYVDSQVNDNEEVPELWRERVKNKNASKLLWKECDCAFRHPLVKQITKYIRALMDAVAKEIERLDPRFEIKPELVGSSNEGTKLDKPDEFDFCFVLTKMSKLCEVSLSPELPTGFVHLKRKPTKAGETKQIDFDGLFREDGILNTEKLKWQFEAILWNALVNIENQQTFEWNFILSQINFRAYAIEKVIKINMRNPLNSTYVNRIRIDIVPCIHVDGWWHDEIISNVGDDIKKFGCNFVFDSPQELYPWVPYSESCARISFAKAESDMIKQSCDNAKEAYMIGKTMIEKSYLYTKYTLKNCLLYCIEALTPTSEIASQLGWSLEELESKFHQMDRYLWLKCLMKCHLEFVSLNFCPCYFLPNFASSVGSKHSKERVYLKEVSLDWIADRIFYYDFDCSFPELCKKAYAFYRCASNDTSESCLQLPAPDPLWERFDRKQLIASLCEIAYK